MPKKKKMLLITISCFYFQTQIFVGCDLPSSCGDDNGILRSLSKNNNNIEPNVIVEPMPYTLSDIDTALAINEEFTNLNNELFDFANW